VTSYGYNSVPKTNISPPIQPEMTSKYAMKPIKSEISPTSSKKQRLVEEISTSGSSNQIKCGQISGGGQKLDMKELFDYLANILNQQTSTDDQQMLNSKQSKAGMLTLAAHHISDANKKIENLKKEIASMKETIHNQHQNIGLIVMTRGGVTDSDKSVDLYNQHQLEQIKPKLATLLYENTRMNWKFYFYTRFFIKNTVLDLWKNLKVDNCSNSQLALKNWYKKQHGPQLHEQIRNELVKLAQECGIGANHDLFKQLALEYNNTYKLL